MEFTVLGPVAVAHEGAAVPLRSARRRVLLAALLLHVGQPVPADRLRRTIRGPGRDIPSATTLHSHVSRLRSTLRRQDGQARITTTATGYELDLADGDVLDATRFEDLVRTARTRLREGEPAEAVERLDDALALWQGPAYADVADHDDVRAEAARLEQLRATATELRADGQLALGHHAEVVEAMVEATRTHPLREHPVALLMRALYAEGRQADALAAYHRHRQRLAEELGLDPTPELAELHDDILRHDPGRRGAAVAVGTGPARPVEPATSFHGREDEPERLAALVRSSRLVTLTGPGGVGKTRLALRVASALHVEHRDGARVAELAPLRDGGAVVHAVADALGVTPTGGRSVLDSVLGALHGRELLLVLDNAEHLLAATADLADRIVRGCPGVRVLVTSRQRMAVAGEHVWPVEPLGPSAAVALFRDRAAAADARRAPELDEAMVARVCRRLDGLPLAIELAAARTAVVPLSELDARMSAHPDLATSGRDRGRHRSLQAVLDWSHALLTDAQASALEQLGAFAASFGLQDAAAVCAVPDGTDAVDLLAALVERSLVQREGDRYRLLAPVRTHARRRARQHGRRASARRRHAAHHLALAERADTGLRGAEEAVWVDRLRTAMDDLRQAHRDACDRGDVGVALRVAAALGAYAQWRCTPEPFAWAERAVALPGAPDHAAYPEALAVAALGATNRGELERAAALADHVVATTGDEDPRALAALHVRGLVALYRGELDACLDMETRVQSLAGPGQPDRAVDAHTTRAAARLYAGDPAVGRAAAEAALSAARELGNPTQMALALHVMAEAVGEVEPDRALACLDEALDRTREVRGRLVEGLALVSRATLVARHRDLPEALRAFRDVLVHWRDLGNLTHQWVALRNLGVLLATHGTAPHAATRLLAAHEHSRTAPPTYGADAERVATATATAHRALNDDDRAAAVAAGRDLDDQVALTDALQVVEGLLA